MIVGVPGAGDGAQRSAATPSRSLHLLEASSDVGGMIETKIWVFLGLMAVIGMAIPFGVRHMKKRSDERVARALQALEAVGHVVDQSTSQEGRPFVRVWGTLEHPVALDLRIARRGGLLGKLGGGGSGGMLDPGFEQVYRVACSEPERARLILDPDVQQRLSRLPKLEFRLGSVETLLPPDHWGGVASVEDRRSRCLWMIRLPTRRLDQRVADAALEVGKMLARQVAKNCLPPGTPDRAAFETAKSDVWL